MDSDLLYQLMSFPLVFFSRFCPEPVASLSLFPSFTPFPSGFLTAGCFFHFWSLPLYSSMTSAFSQISYGQLVSLLRARCFCSSSDFLLSAGFELGYSCSVLIFSAAELPAGFLSLVIPEMVSLAIHDFARYSPLLTLAPGIPRLTVLVHICYTLTGTLYPPPGAPPAGSKPRPAEKPGKPENTYKQQYTSPRGHRGQTPMLNKQLHLLLPTHEMWELPTPLIAANKPSREKRDTGVTRWASEVYGNYPLVLKHRILVMVRCGWFQQVTPKSNAQAGRILQELAVVAKLQIKARKS
ncbi:protein PHYLLO, chloroplastic [Dorcoceras hygrometricum]|uniref:Protein PHYLLO, chloroplastic n=1 Tax=Dorcoceras hygrometricum TaxID=472368 RepID=A0A2Z7C4B9_9LAMI|nr:protein PHYLLO, chloroplastic [Dorcoceras hygrometricum]